MKDGLERRVYEVPNSGIWMSFFFGPSMGPANTYGLRRVHVFDGRGGRLVLTGPEWFMLLANISRSLVESKNLNKPPKKLY